jgi:hypothetical protein
MIWVLLTFGSQNAFAGRQCSINASRILSFHMTDAAK